MAILKSEDTSKWVNGFVAILCALVAYICIQFIATIGEWFDLEAKIKHFIIVGQMVGVLCGVITFIVVMKNKNAIQYLQEVYGELVKVIWPDRDAALKATVGILIGICMVSGFLVMVDWVCRKLLSLLY